MKKILLVFIICGLSVIIFQGCTEDRKLVSSSRYKVAVVNQRDLLIPQYIKEAEKKIGEKKFEEALTLYRKVLLLDPKNEQAIVRIDELKRWLPVIENKEDVLKEKEKEAQQVKNAFIQEREKAQKLEKAYSELEQRLMKPPSEEEVADYLGISVEEFRKTLLEVSGMALLTLEDIALDKEEEGAIRDFIADPKAANPEDQMAFEEAKSILAEAIQSLPKQEKIVLSLYYYEEMTMKEIGSTLDLSESRVSQMHSAIVKRLRQHLMNRSQEFQDDMHGKETSGHNE